MSDPLARLDQWLTTEPEYGCDACSEAGCVDGEIVGRGSLGETVEEICPCHCHEDPEALEESYNETKEDALPWWEIA